MRNFYIAIEGVIGVGKTTLARLLQTRFNAGILLEVFEDNPFLPRFYQDRERYAFQTQIFFLLSRYHQQYQAVPAALQNGSLISDYTFAKDELFAWLNLKDDELAMYGRVHAALGEKIPRPDLIVYLRADHDVLMRRIALRDRPYERDIDPDYIREVAAAYDAWLSRLSDIPVLTINTNDLDYLSRPSDLQQVIDRIADTLDALPDAAQSRRGAGIEQPQTGRMAAFQQQYRDFDSRNGLGGDIYASYLQMIEQIGVLAAAMVRMRRYSEAEDTVGHPEVAATERAALGRNLASLLGRLIRLANEAGIDLEEAFLEQTRSSLAPDVADDRTAAELPTVA